MIINEIKLPINHGDNDIKTAAEKIIGRQVLSYKILKRAVDARKKNDILFVYTISAETESEKLCGNSFRFKEEKPSYKIPMPEISSGKKTFVIGSGPAGLFAAYVLAKGGLKPILVERGKSVEERKKDVDFFRMTGILNTSSNVQFGEGGAGTFSDGKLHTGIKDERIGFILETFAEFAYGEADDILWMAKPHIGTDRLIRIVKNMRNEIIKLGGEVRFETRLVDLLQSDGRIYGAVLQNNQTIYEEKCDNIIAAIGHSARDTFKMLYERGIRLEKKPFAVGVRIEHKRQMIDEAQYGKFAGNPRLGAADYKIVARPKGYRGVYSFCMCPGGFVMPASSEENMLAVNGMSESKRDAENSDSALLVGVLPEDIRGDVLQGVEFQRELERKAFELGGGGYKAPCQLVGDVIGGRKSTGFGVVAPSYKPGVTPTDLSECLPEFVYESIRHALPEFGKMIKGFDTYDAVLTGVESRSSSPVRIIRDEHSMMSVSVNGLYPCGEGAGYAGGIVSAAVDGIKCAEKIICKGRDLLNSPA